jgi:chromosome segregation protein
MTALQRREIIDDLAGLREFDEKKGEALKDLGKVESKIKEVRIVLNERESHLRELEEEKNAALKYHELTQELQSSKATILSLEVKRLEEELSRFAEKEQAIKDKASALLKAREGVKEKIKAQEARFEEINQQLISSSEKTFEGLGKGIEEKKSEVRIAEERIEGKLALISRNENKIKELTENAEKTVKDAKQKKELMGQLKEKKSVLDQNILELDSGVKSKTAALEEKRRQNNSLQQELSALLNEAARKNQDYFRLKSELDSVGKEAGLIEKERMQWEEKKKKLGRRVETKEELNQEIKRTLEAHGDVEEKLTDFDIRLNKSVKKVNAIELKLEELAESLKQLEAAKAACPVCDNSLSSKKKTDLVGLKKKEKTSQLRELKQWEEKKLGLQENLKKYAALKERLVFLNAETRDLNELKDELKEAVKNIERLKQGVFNKEVEGRKNQFNEASIQQDKLKEKRHYLERQIGELKLKERESELSGLIDRLMKSKDARSDVGTQLSTLQVEIEQALNTSEQYAQDEMRQLKEEIKSLQAEIKGDEEGLVKEKAGLKEMQVELKKMIQANKDLLDEKIDLNKEIVSLKQEMESSSDISGKINSELNQLNIEKSKDEVRLTDIKEEFQEFPEVKLIPEARLETLKPRVGEIEDEIGKLGEINMKAIKSFDSYAQELLEIGKKAEKLEEERMSVIELIEKIEFRRTNVFMDCYQSIDANFQKMYSTLGGGEGRLGLTSTENIHEAGLAIEAKHFGEKLKNIESMSGGEKSLTALAFLFAIQLYEPAPFYIFDEADAALDKANSDKLANMIREFSRESQFIAITHNDAMIEQSDQIVGVTLNQQKSSVIGLKVQGT